MTDPIAVLVRAAEDAAAEAVLEPDPVAAVRSRLTRRRRRRQGRAVVAAAAVVVAVAAAGAVVTTRADDHREPVVTDTTAAAPRSADGDVPPSPLNPRSRVAIAAVGDEVVVWGGIDGATTPVSTGAAYDRTTGRWRTIALSPLDGRREEIGGAVPVAAPVEGGIVVARGREAARWDRAADTWTELDPAPEVVTDLVAVGPDRLFSLSAGAVLDVDAGAWVRPVVGPPHRLQQPALVWTGQEVLAIGQSTSETSDRPTVVGFDPQDLEWREVASPSAELVGGFGVAASWDGERVVVTDHEMRAAALDPATGAWEDLPDVPARSFEHHPSSASAGGATATAMARTLAVLSADRRTWTPFPAPNPNDGGGPPGQWLVPVGDDTIATWVDDAGPNRPDLVLFDPTTLGARDRRRQIGAASVELDADEHVSGSVVTPATPTTPGSVIVDVRDPAGRHCRLTSGLGLPPGTAEQRAVEEAVGPEGDPSGEGGRTWFHDAAGRRWETEVGDTDLFVIDCDDPSVARRLAGTLLVG